MTNDERDDLIRSTHDLVLQQDERCRHHAKALAGLSQEIHGNGHSGLKSRVGVLEAARGTTRAEKAGIWGALGTAAGAIALAAWKWVAG